LKKRIERAGEHFEPAAQCLAVRRFCFETSNDRTPVGHAASKLVRARSGISGGSELLVSLHDKGFLGTELSAHQCQEAIKFEFHDCRLLLTRFC
jgi:hypothetical protein